MSEFGFIADSHVRAQLEKSRDRIGRAYDDLFSGYKLSAKDVLNDVLHVDNYPGIVTVKDISFYTFCEHHFLPFFGKAEVSYQPSEIITGIGKIARLVRDVHSRRLQIQETMARDIAKDMMEVLSAKGVYVKLSATHLCMCSRGPSDDNAITDVTYGIGSLKSMSFPQPKIA